MKNRLTVDEFFKSTTLWKKELSTLRSIIRSTSLEETLKWGTPVYTSMGKNIVGIGAFKAYVGLWFFQGALLKDTERKLINAQENKTKALRQWRFSSQEEIEKESSIIKKYLHEAVENEKRGREIKPERKKPLKIPKKLDILLSNNNKLKTKFSALPKYKQREFADYIEEAKKEETQSNRLEKITPMILEGIGLSDKYKK